MSIKTIIRATATATAIVLALLFNTAWAQTFEEGVSAYNEGDYETAFEVFQSFAEEGDAVAQFGLGVMYAMGKGVPQNDSEAVRWYRAAAEQGVADAQFYLGQIYYNGAGVLQDYSEASRWYRDAADQGNANAQYNLALMYANGDGVIQDNVAAHMWFNIASVNGDQKAKHNRDVMADRMSREAIEEAQSRARTCMESGYQNCD